MHRVVASGLLVIAVMWADFGPAYAQLAATPEERAELVETQRALFERMLGQPDDLDLAFEYAAVSARLGDYEAAITALERMLLFAPGLPRVQLELGVMYFRLGSYATAQNYFTEAISRPDAPPEVRSRVEVYLKEIEKQRSPHDFSGSIFAGVRYQTNANAGPAGQEITIVGLPFQLGEQFTEQEDVNFFLATGLRYAYDLGRQGDEIVADLTAYGSRYRNEGQVDSAVLQAKLGPWLDFEKYGYKGAGIRLYGLGDWARLGDEPYFSSFGGGMSTTLPVNDSNATSFKAEYRRLDYRDTTSRPTASNRDGWRVSLDGAFRHKVTPRTAIGATVGGGRENAREEFESRWDIGAGLDFTTHVDVAGRPWRIRADVAYEITRRDEPDLILSTERRVDRERFAQLGLSIPLSRAVGLILQGGYRQVNSNYGIAEYDNSYGLMGVAWNF